MKYIPASEKLINAIGDLQEDVVREMVTKRLKNGDNPLYILDDCQRGMRLVGERYEQGEYYIAGLIMAGEIFRQITELLEPFLKTTSIDDHKGSVLLGTVEGDIHDLGKNILSILLKCYGFTVHDLGVDVSPGKFIEGIEHFQPNIVGLSGLLTLSYSKMKEIVSITKKDNNFNVPIIIGGSQINEQISQMVGTSWWCNDAQEGVRLCQIIIETV